MKKLLAALCAILALAAPVYADSASGGGPSLPVSLTNGGFGASNASTAAARTSIGAAASGANSDITSLSGLTTPLTAGQGGTGLAYNPSDLSYRLNIAGPTSISIPDAADIRFTGSMTMECWVRPNTYPGTAHVPIVDKQANAGASSNYGLRLLASGLPEFHASIQGFDITVDGTTVLPLHEWTHIACSINTVTSKLNIYVNGQLQANTDFTGFTPIFTDTSPVYVALGDGFGHSYDGDIDELRIWSAARTYTQIAANYGAYVPTNSANLKRYFKFDAGFGTTIADSTGIGANGTITNSSNEWNFGALNNPGSIFVTAPNASGIGILASPTALRTNLGAAASGANTDITDLTGLTGTVSGLAKFAPNLLDQNPATISHTVTFVTGGNTVDLPLHEQVDGRIFIIFGGGSSTGSVRAKAGDSLYLGAGNFPAAGSILVPAGGFLIVVAEPISASQTFYQGTSVATSQ